MGNETFHYLYSDLVL